MHCLWRIVIVLKEYHGLTFREIADLIDEAVELSKAGPKPDAEDLLTDVYVSY